MPEDYRDELIAEHAKEKPVKPGYVRIYEDHTYRNYQDFSEEELEQNKNDLLMKILLEEIQKEIDAEVITSMTSVAEE
jgi:hypothetical protein